MEQQDPMKELAQTLLAQFKPEEIEEMKRKYAELLEAQQRNYDEAPIKTLQLQKLKSNVKDIEETE